MLPLDDMLLQAQNGAAIDMVSRQFDLGRDQTVAAMEALLPAFSQGLKRTAATPDGIAPFLQALASGNHARYFDDMSRAFSPAGLEEGNGILGHLFGSKEVSRAVARHAAEATGIGQDILKQMLPALASMIMGGLFKQSTGQMSAAQHGGFGAGGNIIGEVIEQMMRQGGQAGARPAPRQQNPNPFDNPFGKILQDMFGGAMGGQAQQSRRPAPPPDNPLGRIFEEMLGGGQQRPAPPPPRQQPQGKARQPNPYDDLFGQMFEAGRKGRDDYQRGVESIFEHFTKGMDRYR